MLRVSMTKVEIRYALSPASSAGLYSAIQQSHGIYGLRAVKLDPSGESITVVFDASRLRAADVDAALRKAGLPVRRLN
jgi:hypothetical protein